MKSQRQTSRLSRSMRTPLGSWVLALRDATRRYAVLTKGITSGVRRIPCMDERVSAGTSNRLTNTGNGADMALDITTIAGIPAIGTVGCGATRQTLMCDGKRAIVYRKHLHLRLLCPHRRHHLVGGRLNHPTSRYTIRKKS